MDEHKLQLRQFVAQLISQQISHQQPSISRMYHYFHQLSCQYSTAHTYFPQLIIGTRSKVREDLPFSHHVPCRQTLYALRKRQEEGARIEAQQVYNRKKRQESEIVLNLIELGGGKSWQGHARLACRTVRQKRGDTGRRNYRLAHDTARQRGLIGSLIPPMAPPKSFQDIYKEKAKVDRSIWPNESSPPIYPFFPLFISFLSPLQQASGRVGWFHLLFFLLPFRCQYYLSPCLYSSNYFET